MPFCDDVFRIQEMVKGSLVRQISGCFTTETTVQMLTGKHSSLLEEHGIGYTRWIDKCKDPSKIHGPIEFRDKDALPEWLWIENTLPFILQQKKGYQFEALNPLVLCGVFGYLRFPDLYKRVIIPESDIEKQGEYIRRIQLKREDVFHLISYNHFHDACDLSSDFENLKKKGEEVGQYMLDIFKYWDFSEPDSLFWIHSDHGQWRFPWLGGYPLPHNFITWAIIKDNTNNSLIPKLKVISAQDFFSVILSKFGLMNCSLNTNRIYITEDGRCNIDPKKSTTAMACKFDGEFFDYLIYHEPDNDFLQRRLLYFDNKKNFVQNSEKDKDFDSDLVNALKQNFDWVK